MDVTTQVHNGHLTPASRKSFSRKNVSIAPAFEMAVSAVRIDTEYWASSAAAIRRSMLQSACLITLKKCGQIEKQGKYEVISNLNAYPLESAELCIFQGTARS